MTDHFSPPNRSDRSRTERVKQRITPRALLEAGRPGDPQIHPDGRRVAFVSTEADFDESRWISHLWLTEWPDDQDGEPDPEQDPSDSDQNEPADAEPSDSSPPTPSPSEDNDSTRQLTFSQDGETCPRWSPDGRYLTFLSTRPDDTESAENEDDEEDPKEQIWALPIDGGEARRLTHTQEGVLDYAWVPDSGLLCFICPEARARPVESLRKEQRNRRKIDPVVEQEDRLRRQFWRVNVEDRKPKLLTTADFGVMEFAVSPDGKRLCYTTNRTGDPNDYHQVDLYLLDLSSNSSVLISNRPGGKYQPRWSPDGSQIAFLSWLDPHLSYSRQCLFLVDVPPLHNNQPEVQAGSAEEPTVAPEPRLLAESYDFDLETFEWSKEDRALYALAHVRTGSEIVRIAPEPGEVIRLELDPNESRADLTLEPEGGALAWVQESHTALPEIVLRDREGALHTLTRLNTDFADSYLLPHQEVVEWSSSDGMRIEGVLTYPIGYREGESYPLIVQIHGGPKGRATHTLRDYTMPPVWSAEGYAVLRPNFRGSEGYGHAFAIANRRDLGGGDFEDIITGVAWCIERGIADPERLGVMGGSYGGYMTNWAIGHTDKFKAAVSMFGIFHLQTDYSNSSLSRWDNDYMGAYYWEDPEIYRRLSPGSYIEQIKTPTLILHGDDDDNTFISNSKEMYQALRHRGVTTQFVHYPREGHGLREPNHKLDEIRRCLAWMDRYVRGDGRLPVVYRPGDAVPSSDGRLELCVTKAEPATFAGLPQTEESDSADVLLEVVFTLHSRPGVRMTEPYHLALSEISLSLIDLHRDEEGAETEVASPLLPVGAPVEAYGVKILLDGEHLRIVQHPEKETGQIAFAYAAIFRVPKAGGEAQFRIADFPPIRVSWTAEEADEANEEAGEEKGGDQRTTD